jgi:hypothetical protein
MEVPRNTLTIYRTTRRHIPEQTSDGFAFRNFSINFLLLIKSVSFDTLHVLLLLLKEG